MIKYQLKLASRIFIRNKQFTILNLIGLSTGLASVFLIYLWVQNERGIDKFHKNHSRLYQVMHNSGSDGSIGTSDQIPAPAARIISKGIPEIEEAAITIDWQNAQGVVSTGDNSIKAKERFVTNNFFDVFSYRLLEGNTNRLFSHKHAVLLSDELVMKLFRTQKDIIGKTVAWTKYDSTISFTVSGVFEKPTTNSSVQFDLLFSYEFFQNVAYTDDDWMGSSANLYLVLKGNLDINMLNKKINRSITSNRKDWTSNLFLQRYGDRYLYNKYENGIIAGGRIQFVKLFSITGLIILLIAAINFMNLSTAKAAGRMKEIGIKKVSGASRVSLTWQFLTEAALLTAISVIIALLLVWLFLPAFNKITGQQIPFHANGNTISGILAIAVCTSLLAGSYPAFYLSGFKPAAVLKGKINTSSNEQAIRKGLVILQFSLSTIFILAVVVIYQQMQLVQTIYLGYKKDNIVTFGNEGKIRNSLPAFLSDLKQLSGVKEVSNLETDLTGNHGGMHTVEWPGKKPGERVNFKILMVDENYLNMLEFKIVEGRKFSKKFGAEKSKIIFNETAIKEMDLTNPIGTNIKMDMFNKDYEIIGVLKDFHLESLHEKIKPAFFITYEYGRNILAKVNAGSEKETIQRIRKLYEFYNPGMTFEYRFLDDDYQALYVSEQRMAQLSRYFAGLTIILSCLGLFGLVAFIAQKRQKEIGIRKILGATVSNLVLMLSKNFLNLVLVSVLIAFPLGWWLLNFWTQNFAYRIPIRPQLFIITGSAVIFITLLTISFQAAKAALTNPVKTLRAE